MSDLRELYQEVILDHGRRPRNFGPLADANRQAVGHNPLCGDQLTVRVSVADGKIVDVKFEGMGCAISMASASLMTEALRGKTEAHAEALFSQFHDLVAGSKDTGDNGVIGSERLEKLTVFSGVREYPMRVKCATLAWHTLQAALARDGQAATPPVTTE